MNFKTIGIVISREYLNKVKKKSFIWTTLLVPILVAGLTIGVMVALMNTKEKTKNIAVVDASEADKAIAILESCGEKASVIGKVTDVPGVNIVLQ